MDDDLRWIRKQVAQFGKRDRGFRYPESLRERVVAYADKRLEPESVEDPVFRRHGLRHFVQAASGGEVPKIVGARRRRPHRHSTLICRIGSILGRLQIAVEPVASAGGDSLAELAGQFETTELIDVVDVTYRLRKIKQKKYRCRCCQHIDTALPTEDRFIEGGRYSVDFAVHVIEQKYMMHLPLTRQTRQMKLADLSVTSQTLWDQLWHAAYLLEPTWQALRKRVLKEEVVGADETRWTLLNKRKMAKPQIISVTSRASVFYGFDLSSSISDFRSLR